MAKASDVVRRNIMARSTGQAAGKIKDVVVDQPGRQVLGFLVGIGALKGERVVPYAEIQALGQDSVIVNAPESLVKAEQAPDIKAALTRSGSIHGLRVQTTNGKDLGRIEDISFDDKTGLISGYELSGGIFGPHSFMPTPASLELGRDVAFVAPEVETSIEKLSGGVFGR
jgi:uncharacterized protein YrrD